MPKTFLTIAEPTVDRALEATANASDAIDGIEIRFDRLPVADKGLLSEFRERSRKPLLFTRRSGDSAQAASFGELSTALEAGFELVDLELTDRIPKELEAHRSRIVLSFHDFDSMPSLRPLLARMQALGTGHVKIAVTPRTFRDNLKLLEVIDTVAETNVTMIGMGPTGIYSRMLCPMFGSELSFVARDEVSRAAPGQLTLAEARALHGGRASGRPKSIFALVGNPAAHSLSPSIHNPLFRAGGLDAVYVLIETADFGEVAEAVAAADRYAPAGVGVTAPFKQDAFRLVLSRGWEISARARNAGAVNTLVRRSNGNLLAENTDIDGFQAAIERLRIESRETAAVIGSGGTARAALYALKGAGIRCTIFNRTYQRALALGSAFGVSAARLDALEAFEGSLIVNTAGAAVDLPEGVLRPGRRLINVGYTPDQAAMSDRARKLGMEVFDGVEFLEAQAPSQSRFFFEAAEEIARARTADRSAG